jgi:tRNA1(Val) A37 N6-methylase TrmN6
MEAIIVALVTGGLSLIGVIISNKSTENKIQQQLIVNQAVYDTKLEELTREVREHNNFARRMPVVENDIKHLQDEIQHLEDYHK